MRALVDEPTIYRRGFLLLLLTAARRNELFGAMASEVVDDVWILPAERSKNGIANHVALGPWARLLARTNAAWLFPSSRIDGPQLCGWFKVRDRLHERMEKLAGRTIPSWHFHDFRRTFRSNARRIEIDFEIAELMLNHKRKGMAAVYDQSQELELRASGCAAWENHLIKIAIEVGVWDQLGTGCNLADR